MLWLDKKCTLQDLHHQIFDYFKVIFEEWLDWNDPASQKTPIDSRTDLR